jgi:hypothetical protein
MNWDTLLLSQLNGNGRRPVSNEVLQLSARDISIHKLEYAVFITFLSQFNSDGARPVGDKVLQLAPTNVGVHEFKNAIFVALSDVRIELQKFLGDRIGLIIDEINKFFSGDILSV